MRRVPSRRPSLVLAVNVIHCDNYEGMSGRAAALVIAEVENNGRLLLCPATGSSPIGLYRELVRSSETDTHLFEKIRVIKLDEWNGIPGEDPASCESYLKTHLLDPLKIPPERYVGFASNSSRPSEECKRVKAELERCGPIDVCVLGLGKNGHIGFNEPGPFLVPHCHVARLSEESRQHAMVRSKGRRPHVGLTLGMREILASRRIILLVAGEGKSDVIAELLSGRVSTTHPASVLWLHDNADCVIDESCVSEV